MISVVIPLYNKEKQIANTLQTVLNQTFQDFEIVIVDDGSTDNSVAEVEKVHDGCIRLVHQANAGVSAARNRGIKEAKGEYIAFLDADDEWKPEYLETQYKLTQKYPECSVFACNYEFRDSTGKVSSTIIRKLPFEGEDGVLSNYFEVASCSHPPMWTSAVMVRKEAIQAIGGFPLGIKSGEDLLTWARLAVHGKIAYSKEVKAIYILPETSKLGLANRDSKIEDLQCCPDRIGQILEQFHEKLTGKPKEDIKLYLSFWYKMRASINLSQRNRKATILCSIRSLKYNKKKWKVYSFFLVALMPTCLIQKILYKLRK